MFDEMFLSRLKKFIIFILIYTVAFVLFFSTLSYTFPFVIAIIIALITKPITLYLKKKLKMTNGIAAIISTTFVFIIISLLVTVILYKITLEAKELIYSMPNIKTTAKFLDEYILKLKVYYDKIDPSIVEKLQQQLSALLSSVLDISVKIFNKLISFAISLPLLFMIIFITLIATFFITRDLSGMGNRIIAIFSEKGKKNVMAIWEEAIKMVVGYVRSYSIVLFVTFIQTWIGFSILDVKYALMLSILCGIFDILPILGIGAIYTPLSIIYLLSKNYFVGIGIIVLYIIVTLVRQILEPKLVSASLGIHPLAVIAAIFIGIKAYGFIGMIYLIAAMVLYNILKKVEIL